MPGNNLGNGPLWVSLLLALVSCTLLLRGEIRKGNLRFWENGRLSLSYKKQRNSRVLSSESCGEGFHENHERLPDIHQDSFREPARDGEEGPRKHKEMDKEEDEPEWKIWERLRSNIEAIRYDLTSVTSSMPESVALHMLRAADGDTWNSDCLEDTTSPIEVERQALLRSSLSSNCSAIVAAIRNKRRALMITINSDDTSDGNSWDLWAMAARWPILENTRQLELISHPVEANQESIRGHVDISKTPAARRLPVFTLNNDVSDSNADESDPMGPMATLDMLHDSLYNPESKYFYTWDSFSMFDTIMMSSIPQSPAETESAGAGTGAGAGTKRSRDNEDVALMYQMQYPHGLNIGHNGETDPRWWRRFQWVPEAVKRAVESRIEQVNSQSAQSSSQEENQADELLRQLQQPPSPQFWAISPGAALQARYSESHIIRLQLTGRVRYTLFNAEMLPNMYLYPSVDGRMMQSQVHMYRYDHTVNIRDEILRKSSQNRRKSSYERFYDSVLHCNVPENLESSGDIRDESYDDHKKLKLSPCMSIATLVPGQMLYIPPYWTVHAEVLDRTAPADCSRGDSEMGGGVASMVDISSVSDPQLLLAEAWHMHIPLVDALDGSDAANSTISTAERVISAQIYIVHILSRLVTGTGASSASKETPGKDSSSRRQLDDLLRSPQHFAAELYRSRYEKLYPLRSVYVQRARQEFSCYRPSVGGDDEVDDSSLKNAETVLKVINKLDHNLITSRAQFIADALLDPELDKEPIGVRIVWLQNYVERLAYWAMESRDVGRTGLFLLQCLYQTEMLPVTEEVQGPDVIRLDTDESE